ncbi:MAG TPA: hypothetical protein VIN59_02105, partial [Alphaproteobacteria bacterium]
MKVSRRHVIFALLIFLFLVIVAFDMRKGPVFSKDTVPIFTACKVKKSCGDLDFIDCISAFDGPAYYVDRDSQRIVMTCGGSCWRKEGNIFNRLFG